LIPNPEIVVGDVIILQTGDKITADGIVIDSNNMVVDEASLTGESEPIKKGSKDMFCRAGTTVSPRTACLSMHARTHATNRDAARNGMCHCSCISLSSELPGFDSTRLITSSAHASIMASNTHAACMQSHLYTT